MEFAALPLPFQVEGDPVSTILGFLPIIILIVVLVGAMMWILAFISRYFEYLKTVESAWLDRETLDFVRRVLEAVWIAFMAIGVLTIAQVRSTTLHDYLVAFVRRVPSIFLFVFVLFAAAIVVRAIHRFAAYLRGELKAKPKRVAPTTALAFTEIVLKYVIYISALVIATLGSLRALPPEDQAYVTDNIGTLPSVEPIAILEVLLGFAIVVIADRFVDSIFEDLKRRTTKFSARMLDEFKGIARYGVWIVGAIVLLFIFLGLILSESRLIVFVVGFVSFMVVVGIIAFEPVRNALAGVTLLRGDPFDVGNRVKIGDDLVCDVVSMTLTMTRVRTLRGEIVQIPNTRLLEMPVVNFSRSKPYAIFVEVSVAFDVAHERVRDLLVKAATETEGIVKDRAPEVFGTDVEGDAVLYQLFAYTDQPERMKEIKSALVFKIQDLFGGAGIRPSTRASGS